MREDHIHDHNRCEKAVDELKARLLEHENAMLTAMMNVRYILDFCVDPVDPADLSTIRRSARGFIATAERLALAQAAEAALRELED